MTEQKAGIQDCQFHKQEHNFSHIYANFDTELSCAVYEVSGQAKGSVASTKHTVFRKSSIVLNTVDVELGSTVKFQC